MKKKAQFTKARFIASAYKPESFPKLLDLSGNPMPEIALLGRSNVGKSSLINHLLKNSTLAKTSSTPGKTQSINFFSIDEQIALVDLPGYGYAKVSQETKKQWAGIIDHYLHHRETLALLLLLIDARRQPTEEDIAIIHWARSYQKPLLVVFTKTDKLKPQEKKQNAKIALELLEQMDAAYYSIKDPHSRIELIRKIDAFLWD